MTELTFIVGTGRAASTMLTKVLHRHPDVLSLNELCTALGPRAFRAGVLDGPRFWSLLARPRPGFDAAIRSGAVAPEILYPRLRGGRFHADSGIPAICLTTLPGLTDAPDELYDQLEAEVSTWPTRTAAAHWMSLFSWFCNHFRRRVVVERSGFSVRFVPLLRATFPNARFVHLYRNGPDCAESMSRHPGFRMILLLQRMCAQVGVGTIEEVRPAHAPLLPADLAALLADRYDPALVLDRAIPVAEFGKMWSDSILQGLANLAHVPLHNRTNLRYETLVAQPHDELRRLAEFIRIEPTPAWLSESAAVFVPGHQAASARLSPGDRAALDHACRPGMRALHYLQPDATTVPKEPAEAGSQSLPSA